MTDLKAIIKIIISNPELHAKWINTLSYMENVGARKISKFEHRTETSLMILKHAAEEARHAFFLKKQIQKIDGNLCPSFSAEYILAPYQSLEYLNFLDVGISRFLKEKYQLTGYDLKFGAYLLTTYAIEIRANDIYPVYQDVLTAENSEINVKSIIQEEIGHLEEMEKDIVSFFSEPSLVKSLSIEIESNLFQSWINALKKETETVSVFN